MFLVDDVQTAGDAQRARLMKVCQSGSISVIGSPSRICRQADIARALEVQRLAPARARGQEIGARGRARRRAAATATGCPRRRPRPWCRRRTGCSRPRGPATSPPPRLGGRRLLVGRLAVGHALGRRVAPHIGHPFGHVLAAVAGLAPLEVEPARVLPGAVVGVRAVVDAGRLAVGSPSARSPRRRPRPAARRPSRRRRPGRSPAGRRSGRPGSGSSARTRPAARRARPRSGPSSRSPWKTGCSTGTISCSTRMAISRSRYWK